MEPVTVHDVAVARGVKEDEDGSVGMDEYLRVGLPMLGGCYRCGASIACYNSCPTKVGYLMCKNGCVGDDGFATTEEFEEFCKKQDEEE
jgi:hypothetical protein